MIDYDSLEAFLDAWMADQGFPMHSTTLERLVDGIIEHEEGAKRVYAEWEAAQ